MEHPHHHWHTNHQQHYCTPQRPATLAAGTSAPVHARVTLLSICKRKAAMSPLHGCVLGRWQRSGADPIPLPPAKGRRAPMHTTHQLVGTAHHTGNDRGVVRLPKAGVVCVDHVADDGRGLQGTPTLQAGRRRGVDTGAVGANARQRRCIDARCLGTTVKTTQCTHTQGARTPR